MDVRAVRRYLEDWYRAELPEVVERELGVREVPRKAVAVVGPRRAGKTFYFFQLLRGARAGSLYLNFEDPLLVSVRGADILGRGEPLRGGGGRARAPRFPRRGPELDGWVVAVRGLWTGGTASS
jgi:hypothetical protein